MKYKEALKHIRASVTGISDAEIRRELDYQVASYGKVLQSEVDAYIELQCARRTYTRSETITYLHGRVEEDDRFIEYMRQYEHAVVEQFYQENGRMPQNMEEVDGLVADVVQRVLRPITI